MKPRTIALRARRHLRPLGALALASLVACTASDTAPDAAKPPAAAVAHQPLATAPATAPAPPAGTPPLAVDVPADKLYVCVAKRDGETRQTVIEFAPKVAELCRRHPEMGPCQYERNECRARGGRVFAAGGVEVTMQTEADYDRKVMRTRFRAN